MARRDTSSFIWLKIYLPAPRLTRELLASLVKAFIDDPRCQSFVNRDGQSSRSCRERHWVVPATGGVDH